MDRPNGRAGKVVWLLVPPVLIASVCWPAIDARTRLIFGRYIGFRVTIKNRLAQAHEIRYRSA